MTRRSLIAALICAALVPATATGATNGQLADTCAQAGQQAVTVMCYGGDVLVRDGQAYADPGRYESGIEAYEHSWTHKTIQFQYRLANDVGFANAPWLGTHNSFNSINQQGPALSTTDANQQLTLVDQLRLDMRSLELDVHWFPSVRANGANAPVVCHAGAVSDHDGCSTEPLLGPVLDQIDGWLKAHPDQVLLLYVEDHLKGLDGSDGYPATAAAINSSIGSLVYPTGSANGTPKDLPLGLTRDDVLAAHKQVVIVSNSGGGGGADFRKLAYTWNSHVEETPHGFKDFPNCGPNFTRATYDSKLVRYYEDSTWLSAGNDAVGGSDGGEGLSPTDVRAMVRCGVDLFGFDQLTPGDGRLDAAVWSWAKGQPSRRGCASMGSDGRWYSTRCNAKLPAACRASDGSWTVTTNAVKQQDAASECAASGSRFDAPRTGYDNELLKTAAAGKRLWLGVPDARAIRALSAH